MPIDVLIEGLLFYKSSPQKKRVIMKLFEISEVELAEAIKTLRERLLSGAIRLSESDEELQLVTAPELSPVIEAMRKNDLRTDIGKAGAETLAIILYREPVTRSEIDRIRGVNSSFILRNLQVRGLIESKSSRRGGGYEYTVTTELLSHLGVTHKHELPDFARISDALDNFKVENTEVNII